jgi:hypothetical protein
MLLHGEGEMSDEIRMDGRNETWSIPRLLRPSMWPSRKHKLQRYGNHTVGKGTATLIYGYKLIGCAWYHLGETLNANTADVHCDFQKFDIGKISTLHLRAH